MVELGHTYDYIFLEAAALNKYSDARELVDFVEKVIPVLMQPRLWQKQMPMA